MDAGKEWGELCDQYSVANDEWHESFAVIVQKFNAIASGKSSENPSDDELKRFEDARRRRDTVDKAMRAFMKNNFGVDM